MQFRHIDVALMLAACAAMPLAQAAEPRNSPNSAAEAGQSVGQFVDDATLTTKVKTALVSDNILSLFQISVESNKGMVTLSGAVDKPETIQRAIRLASAVPGVKGLNLQLQTKTATN